MKSLFSLALIACLTFGSITNAQETTSSTNEGTKNFRFQPVVLIIGAVALHMDFQVADQWTIGPELFVWKYDSDYEDATLDDYEVSIFSGGVRGNWFKNGVFNDGLYVAPSVTYYNIEATGSATGASADGKANGVLVGALVGYGWFWRSFNQMLGAGLSTAIGDNDATITDSNGNKEDVDTRRTGFSFEYTLGWTF